MKLDHYKRICLLFSVFFLLTFTIEALADEKSKATSKSSSALSKQTITKKKVDAQKKKALTAQQLIAKKKAEAEKAAALKKQQAAAKQKALANQRALTKRKVDAQKQKALANQRGLTKRKVDAQKQKALANQQTLGGIKANSQKRKLFPSKLAPGKVDKRQTLSGNKKPMQALKQRTKRRTVGKEEVSGVSKVVVIPGGGMMPGNSGNASGRSERVKPEDLSNQDMSSGKGKITGMDLGVIGRDSPLVETESPLDEANKMRESLNEVQVIGGLDGRNDAQDGGGATSPGAALPDGVGDPTGMVGDETITGTGGVKMGNSKKDGVKSTGVSDDALALFGGLSQKATGTDPDSTKGKMLGEIMDELDDLGSGGGPTTHKEYMKEVDKIQKSKTMTPEQKQKKLDELGKKAKEQREAAEATEEAKKKAEEAAGETDPETGGDRPETLGTASLDAFTNKYHEDKQKANAGADIDYGDNIVGTTNKLNEDAAKGLPEQVTGQYGEGHQSAGKPTEKDKQRLLDAADQGTKF